MKIEELKNEAKWLSECGAEFEESVGKITLAALEYAEKMQVDENGLLPCGCGEYPSVYVSEIDDTWYSEAQIKCCALVTARSERERYTYCSKAARDKAKLLAVKKWNSMRSNPVLDAVREVLEE